MTLNVHICLSACINQVTFTAGVTEDLQTYTSTKVVNRMHSSISPRFYLTGIHMHSREDSTHAHAEVYSHVMMSIMHFMFWRTRHKLSYFISIYHSFVLAVPFICLLGSRYVHSLAFSLQCLGAHWCAPECTHWVMHQYKSTFFTMQCYIFAWYNRSI